MTMQTVLISALMALASVVHGVDSTRGLGGVIDGNRYEVSWVQGKDITAIIRIVRFGDKMDPAQYSSNNGETSIVDGGTAMVVGTVKLYNINGSRLVDAKDAEPLKQLLKADKIDSAKVAAVIKDMMRG